MVTGNKRPSRTIGEVRLYLLQRVNSALRRPGMFGGENALRLYFDAIAFLDRCEQSWAEDLSMLESRGAFVSAGVTGAVQLALGHRADDVMASVYAEIAHQRAWLTLDKVLSRVDDEHIHDQLRTWCAHDRTHRDVLAEFGPPSLLIGGSNPLYPKTLAYVTTRIDDPLLFFHLWNGTKPKASTSWPPDHSEPVVLAARCGRARFIDGFTFTPTGAAHRAQLGGRLQRHTD